MRDFPSCFGEHGVQIADSSCSSANKASQNVVTCVYKCKLLGRSCLITITWSKSLMGQCLTVEIDDSSSQCLCKFDVKPSLFTKRKGFKSLELNYGKIEVYWDLSGANFGSGPEPLEGYYLAVVCNGEMNLIIGDLRREALKKTNASPALSSAMFISKREHLFGKRLFGTKAQFCDNGPVHSLTIECDTVVNDPCLVIRIDSKMVIQVKRLPWKFRGNQTIWVDGLPVDVFWDVHNWLFGRTAFGNAVFMFQTCSSAEKLWAASQTFPDPCIAPWPLSQTFGESQLPGLGFSLVLYAWKNE